MIHCDDDECCPPDRTPLYAALATALGSVLAAVLPGLMEDRRRERRRLERLERDNLRLRAQLADDEEDEGDS